MLQEPGYCEKIILLFGEKTSCYYEKSICLQQENISLSLENELVTTRKYEDMILLL